jgi:hypothetical protein
MLDPWPYQPDITKEDYLMKRYAQGNTLQRAISHVILYEAYGSGGPISTPGTGTVPTAPTPAPTTPGEPYARVRADVTWGLNIRSSMDTSNMANVVVTVPAGTQLLLLEADGYSRVGGVNQWVRVRTPDGREGFCAAWFLEKVPAETPPPAPQPAPGPGNEAPVPPPTPPTPTPIPTEPPPTPTVPEPEKLKLKVSSLIGASGLRMRKYPSLGGALILTLKAGTRITALDPVDKVRERVGKAGQWLYVRESSGRRGYVAAQFVQLA